jgi:hypothetical protein
MSVFPSANPPRRRPPVATPIYDEDDYEDEDQWQESEDEEDGLAQASDLLEDEEEDIAMLAVEERIEAANYLRALLTTDLFGGDASVAAGRVQRMVRSILRRELEILLGLKMREAPVAVVESPFTPEEVNVLKLLAARARDRASGAPQVTVQPVTVTPPAPSVTVTPPKSPQVTPVRVAPSKQKPAPVKAKPQGQPQQKPSSNKERAPAKQARKPEPPQPQGELPPVDPVSGMHVEMKGEVRRTKNGRIKRTLVVGDQKITNDLTPQVVNPNRLPMPQGAQFTAITQMQAAETVNAQGGKASQIAAVALQS